MTVSEKNEDQVVASPSSTERGCVVHLTTVHHPYDPRIFQKQLKSLRAKGFDTHLVAPHDRKEREDGVTIHPIPDVQRRWARAGLQPAVWNIARSLDADLYQIHDPELIPLAFLLQKTTGARIIYDMHEDYRSKGPVVGRILRLLEKWCFRWVDHVLLAEKSYRSILSGHTVPYTLIENYHRKSPQKSTDKEEGTTSLSEGPAHLLYTGTISESRGLGTMVDLATELRRREYGEQVSLVGICRYPDQRQEAERRIEKEELATVIERVGWETYVPTQQMQRYYHRADVGLALCNPHPNLTQSLLTKFYEYLHYGLPIICSNFPLWRDFVERNGCGVVVPPGNATAVVRVLDRWNRRPEEYTKLVENAREAASKYRWEIMGERLVQVYHDLLSVGERKQQDLSRG